MSYVCGKTTHCRNVVKEEAPENRGFDKHQERKRKGKRTSEPGGQARRLGIEILTAIDS